MENISLLTYTHSNCTDVHKIYFDSIGDFFKNITHYTLTNEQIDDDRTIQVIYDDNSDYYEQMLQGLSKIKTDYLIYSQEDYILYDEVNLSLLNDYVKLLDNNKDVMFLRLISAGLHGNEPDYNENFVIIDSDNEYLFSTQITLWRKESLEQMFRLSKSKYIYDEPKNSPYLKQLNGLGLCTKLKGNMVGNHFNSLIYPYTAVAILRGKWNFSQYGEILEKLLNKYNIDKNKRGLI